MKKQKVIGLLVSLGCCAIATGVGVSKLSASAATTLGGVDVSSFRMGYGASVRFTADDGKNGIRFSATLADKAYADLEALTGEVNYGMLIVPADIVSGKPLTKENVFGTSAQYTLVADCNPDGEECTCGKEHIISVKYAKLADANATDGVKNLRGSIVDILPTNLNREFVGLGYIEYKNGTATDYVLAENAFAVDKNKQPIEGTADQKNNTRSMTYVAQLAIEAGDDDEDNTLQTDYVAPLLANDYAYTVNHYLPTGESGAYVLEETERLYGKLGTPVAATNIAKSSLENRAEYVSYATYSFDSAKGAVSGTLYANEKTVLNCYYQESDTTLWSASDSDDVDLLTQANTYNNDTSDGWSVETVDSYEGSGKAVKMIEQNNTNKYGAGRLRLKLDSKKLAVAENANWDYLNFRMRIEVAQEGGSQNTAVLYSSGVPLTGSLVYDKGNKFIGGTPLNEWVDVIVPKALLNNVGSAVLSSKTYSETQAKSEFDTAFRKLVGGTSEFFFAENLEPIDSANPTVTYYIEKITWGVDTTAPEVVSISKAYEGVAYTPVVTLKDDIVPTNYHYATPYGLNATTKIYEVNGGSRTEVAIGSVLDKEKTYVVEVTADDCAVTNLAGNVLTKEIPVTVCSATDIVNVGAYDDLSEFALTTYSTTHSTRGTAIVTPTVSLLNTYEGHNGVAKYTSQNVYFEDVSYATNNGGYVYLNLSDEKATEIANAFTDTNSTFTLKLSIRVEVADTTKTTFKAVVGKQGITDLALNEWIEVEYSEADMTGWNTVTAIKKALQGSSPFLYLENAWTTTKGKQAVYIYIDSITYSVTPNA